VVRLRLASKLDRRRPLEASGALPKARAGLGEIDVEEQIRISPVIVKPKGAVYVVHSLLFPEGTTSVSVAANSKKKRDLPTNGES